MQLKSEQYEEIKQVVIETYQEYDVKCIPINAFELAIKMGLKLIAYSSLSEEKKKAAKMISADGYSVELSNGTWIIYYNDEGNNYERMNRTIMHEIGHYSLGHNHEGVLEEIEANFFAKYALAPPPLVHKLPIINVKTIKYAFDISWEAAKYAYKYYNDWLKYGEIDYTPYEIELLELFKVA
jgi:Zn-dependent peptidase ImmA (M78 family)|nr:MAG TPA: IrrE protein [Caudoviricetes sp.]